MAECAIALDVVDGDSLWEQMEQEVMRMRRYGRPCTMAVFDPDDWAAYTRCQSSDNVEDALKVIGSLAGQVVRDVDMVAHIHDEAFAVLLPETEMEGGLCVGERLRWAVDGVRLSAKSEKRPLTVSVGVAEAHGGTLTAGELFTRALAARDLARLHGGNRVMAA